VIYSSEQNAIVYDAKDPLEAFCETDPSADECRVYSD
jgi:hypothetical protein